MRGPEKQPEAACQAWYIDWCEVWAYACSSILLLCLDVDYTFLHKPAYKSGPVYMELERSLFVANFTILAVFSVGRTMFACDYSHYIQFRISVNEVQHQACSNRMWLMAVLLVTILHEELKKRV